MMPENTLSPLALPCSNRSKTLCPSRNEDEQARHANAGATPDSPQEPPFEKKALYAKPKLFLALETYTSLPYTLYLCSSQALSLIAHLPRCVQFGLIQLC